MNLHPLTLVLLLALAFIFYSQGQEFFLLATIAIGFLLFVTSLSEPGPAASHGEGKSGSLYPEKMEIKVSGDSHASGDGQKELGENIGGFIDFTGKVVGWLLPLPPKAKKEEKK